ncbi:MAG TPA: hypothetical protein VKV21_05400, partial [Solirubrobacteraceae bacterium]|nr:hypothetical protein [Solirubrobacteraceae bacterium]
RISWGDGTTSTGTVTGTPPTPTSVNGLYTVSGSHRYGHAGVHLVTVTATASGTPPAMTVYFVRVGSVTG